MIETAIFKRNNKVIYHSMTGLVPVRIISSKLRHEQRVYTFIASIDSGIDWDYTGHFSVIEEAING